MLSLLALFACKEDKGGGSFSSTGQAPVLTGEVCSPSGVGIGAAYVYIPIDEDGDGTEDSRLERWTDGSGDWEFDGLDSGDYTIEVVKGQFTLSIDVEYEAESYHNVGETCFTGDEVSMAVVTGLYDSIEEMLSLLGFEPTIIEGRKTSDTHLDFLSDPAALAKHDIIFLNCGMAVASSLPGSASSALAGFIQDGGSVYASDWALVPAASIFSGSITVDGYTGLGGYLSGNVLNSRLEDLVGDAVDLNYDLDAWVVLTGVGSDTEVLIEGDAPSVNGTITNSPLAAMRQETNLAQDQLGGRLLYTTFHNEVQLTRDMEDILLDFIMSL